GVLWQRSEHVLVLVWKSETDLQEGKQPIILQCRISANNAGPDSLRRGTNQSSAPIAGFHAVLLDEDQLAAMHQPGSATRSAVSIWSGRDVEVYDFEYPTSRTDSAQVDGSISPKYQYYFEVDHVVFPEDGERPEGVGKVWGRDSFAVAESKDSARI